MKINTLFSAIFLAVVIWSLPAHAATDAQYDSIRTLGALNGVALQCKYIHETRRMKKVMVASLPKRRQLGQVFDEATNEGFLAFIQDKASCPDQTDFAGQVDAAIDALKAAFSGEQAQ